MLSRVLKWKIYSNPHKAEIAFEWETVSQDIQVGCFNLESTPLICYNFEVPLLQGYLESTD